MSEPGKCELCGEPMPLGEQMFRFHGYSGPCPKPPLERKRPAWIDAAAKEIMVHCTHTTGSVCRSCIDALIRARYPSEGASDALCAATGRQPWQIRGRATCIGVRVDTDVTTAKRRKYNPR